MIYTITKKEEMARTSMGGTRYRLIMETQEGADSPDALRSYITVNRDQYESVSVGMMLNLVFASAFMPFEDYKAVQFDA